MNPIYLDNNATTHIFPEVMNEMLPILNDNYGNPSSSHELGKYSKLELEKARTKVAQLLGCKSQNIIFTSGGTEGNNLALKGFAETLKEKHHFITSMVEHSSVLENFNYLEKNGHTVTYLPVDHNGLLYPNQVEEVIKSHPNTALISIMFANNETGVLFPIKEIGKIAKKYNILFHCDAVQGVGKIPIDVNDLNIDLLTISGHKIHGPKGCGALYIRDMNKVAPLIHGGGQENGKRSGTESLPTIVGFGKACEIISNTMDKFIPNITKCRDLLEQGIIKIMPTALINGYESTRLCNTTNIQFSGIRGKDLLDKLSQNKIYVSHGSACSNNHLGNSHVLKAMGLTDSQICSSLRFSLSRETTECEINEVLKKILQILSNNIEKNMEFIGQANFLSPSNEDSTLKSYGIIEKDLRKLWTLTMGDPNISIAILDGSVDLSHNCFKKSNIKSIDFLNNKSTVKGTATSHGTHVTSIIFGQHSCGVPGIAPNCTGIIIPIYSDNIGNNSIKCTQEDLAAAILKAVELGANIINISSGQLVHSENANYHLMDAIKICDEKGVLIVAAAGNDGCRCLHIPASIPSVLAVGSMDSNGVPKDYSNWGDAYQFQGILAPGENILGAAPDNKATTNNGTSFAAPIVTGIIALFLSYQIQNGIKPNALAIRDSILNNALPCHLNKNSETNRCLAGILNISGTLQEISKQINLKNKNNTFLISKFDKSKFKMKGSSNIMDYENNNIKNISVSEETNNTNLNNSNKSSKSLQGDSIELSGCGCPFGDSAPSLVYALGSINYDFSSEARRDSFIQMMSSSYNPTPNPYDPKQLLEYLNENPAHASSIIWTLNQESTPIYAIQPIGPFGYESYKILRSFLKDTANGISDIVSIPGIISGSITLMNGYTVPVIIPELRGMYNWSVTKLVESIMETPTNQLDLKAKQEFDRIKDAMSNFLKRVYYELRNLGRTSQERALNYTGTNLAQIQEVLEDAILKGLALDTIEAEPSKICRPNSDCWDIKLTLFHPEDRLEKARHVYFFTLDVSDVVPVSIGTVRSWEAY